MPSYSVWILRGSFKKMIKKLLKKLKKVRPRKITWDYLAGFFDGEGCIFYEIYQYKKYKCHRFECHITQSQSRSEVLFLIKDFLKMKKIKSRIIFREPGTEKAEPQFRLIIGGMGYGKEFLEKIIPFLFVKREKAKKALKFISQRKGYIFTLSEKEKIFNLLNKGHKIIDIAREVDRPVTSLYEFFKRIKKKNREIETNISERV